jgi:predicted Zn-dependent protease with MMP-like domain
MSKDSPFIPGRNEPGPESFARMAEAAYQRIPASFRQLTDELSILTPDWPARDVLDELSINDPLGLLGLYQGVDVTRKSLFDVETFPDTVYLYREPILQAWRDGMDSLERLIEHVLVHEIGHHFGFSDDDMEFIEESD